eukprot:scaffold72150_cov26-Tisochrysis_lutea.AAC.5
MGTEPIGACSSIVTLPSSVGSRPGPGRSTSSSVEFELTSCSCCAQALSACRQPGQPLPRWKWKRAEACVGHMRPTACPHPGSLTRKRRPGVGLSRSEARALCFHSAKVLGLICSQTGSARLWGILPRRPELSILSARA